MRRNISTSSGADDDKAHKMEKKSEQLRVFPPAFELKSAQLKSVDLKSGRSRIRADGSMMAGGVKDRI
jgi:hypothetical protein